ncbi:transposase family protein [Streptomyces nigrescens]|uniref:Transposase family protein n=1 Tax=Streptomyces nigrescens TaxID=1920 RepID=A0ABY7J213_STRNI|nr:transposase family protein [Streptomyces nigrescens]WAU03786.1 transposase family protein [Streptomyces nigrescens]
MDGTEIRVRRPAAGRKDRDKFISGKSKVNAVKSMVVTDGEGRVLGCSPTRPGSGPDIAHARQLELVKLLAGGPAVEVPGLVRGHVRASAQGAFLTPHPCRARHRTSEELARAVARSGARAARTSTDSTMQR